MSVSIRNDDGTVDLGAMCRKVRADTIEIIELLKKHAGENAPTCWFLQVVSLEGLPPEDTVDMRQYALYWAYTMPWLARDQIQTPPHRQVVARIRAYYNLRNVSDHEALFDVIKEVKAILV